MGDMSEAKQLFLKYGGSLFHMDREGEYQRYKCFGVSRELEEAWIEELRSDLLRSIANEDDGVKIRLAIRTLVDSIWNRGGYELDPQMLDIIKSKAGIMDSFSQLLVAESIAKLVDSCKCKGESIAMVPYAVDTAVEILERIVENPISVAQEDRDNAVLKEVVQPHRIVERAHECLLKLKN